MGLGFRGLGVSWVDGWILCMPENEFCDFKLFLCIL